MEIAAALADAVFHHHLWAASARAWMDANLVLFWVWHFSSPPPWTHSLSSVVTAAAAGKPGVREVPSPAGRDFVLHGLLSAQ
jgi:hypothetical protein